VLLIGAGEMSELAAAVCSGKAALHPRDCHQPYFENAAELAERLGATAIPYEERRQHMAEADIIITSTSCRT